MYVLLTLLADNEAKYLSSAGALNVALLYLAGSSASLLENAIVEKEQIASAVYYSTEDHPSIEIRFTLTSVETEKLGQVEKRFFEILNSSASM